jgi:hypothetical protein
MDSKSTNSSFNFCQLPQGSFSIPTRKMASSLSFLFIYAFIVSFNRSNSFRKHSKFEHPTGSSGREQILIVLSLIYGCQKISFNFKIFSESFRIP